MASRYLDTARSEEAHPAPRAKSLAHIRAVPSKAFADRINAEREAAGWSYETLGRVLGGWVALGASDGSVGCRACGGKGKARASAVDERQVSLEVNRG